MWNGSTERERARGSSSENSEVKKEKEKKKALIHKAFNLPLFPLPAPRVSSVHKQFQFS